MQVLAYILSLFTLFSSVAASREAFSEYVTSDGLVYATTESLAAAFDGPRDFTIMMLMTSESGRVDCPFCAVLGPEFRAVASSYSAQLKAKADEERRLFFVIAEPDNVLSVFQDLGLSHVPNVVIYEPTKSRSEAKQGLRGPHNFMSFRSNGDQQQALLVQLARLGFKIEVQRPFQWEKLVRLVVTVAMLAGGVYLFRAQVLRVWQSKQVWLAMSLMLIIMFISGHMFNVTRGMPFMGFDGKNARFIEPGFSTQVAAETQILAVVYALLSFTTIGLLKFVPRLETVKAQSFCAIVATVAIFLFYSAFLDIFKIKMGSFPLWLLPFSLV